MILANAAVGEQLYKSFPNSALLRKHPFPVKSHFNKLIKSAKMMVNFYNELINKYVILKLCLKKNFF